MIPTRAVLPVVLALAVAAPAARAQGGAIDTTFGRSGIATLGAGVDIAISTSRVLSLPGGRIVLGGRLPDADIGLTAYDAQGNVDPSFGTAGRVREDMGGGLILAAYPDGRLVLGGIAEDFPEDDDMALVRLRRDGSHDAAFGVGGRVQVDIGETDDQATHVIPMEDGRIVVVGVSRQSSSTMLSLARLLPDGQLDPTLDGDGRVIPILPRYGATRDVAVDGDGRIIVARGVQVAGGTAIELLRFRHDGALDESFGTAGTVTLTVSAGYASAKKLEALPDGRLLIIGHQAVGDGYDGLLAQLLPDGTLDPAFGVGGRVNVDFGSRFDCVEAGEWLSDGRITLAGCRFGATGYDIVVARRLPDGSPDLAFGVNGLVDIDFGGGTDYARALALLPDAAVAIVADATIEGAGAELLARLRPNGDLDTGFGDNGLVYPTFVRPSSLANAIVAGSHGSLYVAGQVSLGPPRGNDFLIARLLSNGTRDTTFGDRGITTIDFGVGSDDALALALYPDGRLVVAGTDNVGAPRFAAVRLLADGTLDSTFGNGGRVSAPIGNALAGTGARAVVVQADGKVVLAGASLYPFADGGWQMTLARVLEDGSLDPAFGTGGVVTAGVSAYLDRVNALALLPDGRLIAAGAVTRPPATTAGSGAARFLPNGAIDSTFGQDGFVFGQGSATSLAVMPDGRPVLAGYAPGSGPFSNTDFSFHRFLTDGEPDVTFGGDGNVSLGAMFDDDAANAVAILPDGRIAAAGYTEEGDGFGLNWAVCVLLDDGTPDTAFDGDGRMWINIGANKETANGLVALPDGRIVAAGVAYTEDGVDATLVRILTGPVTATNPSPGAVTPSLDVVPNPIRGSARVRYTLRDGGIARLSVYDILGRRVATLYHGAAGAGRNEATLQTEDFEPGVYLVRLEAAGTALTRRVTVTR